MGPSMREHQADLDGLELENLDDPPCNDILQDGVRGMAPAQAWNLYVSHALSTWNVRTYEFAAILFTASAYPQTLLASSIRGICNTLASICLSSLIGSWIDRAPSRLRTLLLTISSNRGAVILACLGWMLLVDTNISDMLAVSKHLIFSAIVGLGILEKLSGAANMISMERDWIPILAAQTSGSAYDLTHLNAVMRRIDLVCKLISPLMLSIIISASGSTRIGVMVVAGMSASSWGLEMWCARRVWHANPQLRQAKNATIDSAAIHEPADSSEPHWPQRAMNHITTGFYSQIKNLMDYFGGEVWMPSLSLALLHLSVLSYSATFLTYLLDSGFSLILITIARSLGSVVEVSSTFVAPVGVQYLSRHSKYQLVQEDAEAFLESPEIAAQDQASHQHLAGLERLGLWGIWSQFLNLVPVVLAVWQISASSKEATPMGLLSRIVALATPHNPTVAAVSLFTFLSLSRLGLWTFDLTTQELTQIRIPAQTRSSFAGTEMAFVSVFELAHWVAAAILSRPEDFRWLAVGSLGAVGLSTCTYAFWVRQQRGHLMHWGRMKGCGCGKPRDRC
ncbi:MAG: hypothetical protein FRX48_07353 [Lasallia pustulata]|uniref:Solute carrier family 40 member n=1 Tax=Lasallia pustulata TaxID=136370 RepID=A0A5M8PHZ5_9LECA|nr:MAG: hypothetical protein FRX48_07353 [Lasallia pustulata]